MIILIIYVFGVLINLLAAFIQSRMISSGVTQVERDRHGEAKEMHNSFLNQELMPSLWIVIGLFWLIAWPAYLVVSLVDSLDCPKPKKNKLIEEAEDQGLDLKEFVKKGAGLRK